MFVSCHLVVDGNLEYTCPDQYFMLRYSLERLRDAADYMRPVEDMLYWSAQFFYWRNSIFS